MNDLKQIGMDEYYASVGDWCSIYENFFIDFAMDFPVRFVNFVHKFKATTTLKFCILQSTLPILLGLCISYFFCGEFHSL